MITAPATEDKGWYLLFTPDTSEDTARAGFVAKYGKEPERVFKMYPGNYPAAGPIPGEEQTG